MCVGERGGRGEGFVIHNIQNLMQSFLHILFKLCNLYTAMRIHFLFDLVHMKDRMYDIKYTLVVINIILLSESLKAIYPPCLLRNT